MILKLSIFYLQFVWIPWLVTCDHCPPPALKIRHAVESCADPTYYHCLWNKLTKDYKVCLKPKMFTAGSYMVFASNLDARECPSHRYQPFPFQSNELNACVYMKSTCTEEGQKNATRGSTTDDATCKCDFTKGYSYVVLPKDPCSCKPSEEDCSCYITGCLNGTHQLSPDYKCEQKDINLLRQYQCLRITSKGTDIVHHKPRNNTNGDESKNNVVRQSVDTSLIAIIVTVLVLMTIAVFVVCCKVCMYKQRLYLHEVVATWTITAELKDIIDRSYKHYRNVIQENIVQTTSAFRHAKLMITDNHVVILKGRRGTGKTTLAMCLASIYVQQQYILAICNGNEAIPTDIQNSGQKFVVILEEWIHTETAISQLDMLNVHNFRNDIKFILTATCFDGNILDKLSVRGIATGSNAVNLDDESTEDNQSILKCLLRKYKRELSDTEITEAAATKTYYGFPLQCSMFCRDFTNFQLGSKYFRQPPADLNHIINELKMSKKQQDKIMYCILVYIILNPETGLPINGVDVANISSILKEVYRTSYLEKYMTSYWENPLSEKDVKNGCRELSSKDLLLIENNVYLLNAVVYQAVMISYSNVCLKKVICKCDLFQVIKVVRPSTYDQLDNEVVLIINCNKSGFEVNILAKRMANSCLHDKTAIRRILQYIRKFKFSLALRETIDHLDPKLKSVITDQRVGNIVTFMIDMTSNGRSLELVECHPTTFVLTLAFIVLQKSGQTDLIDTLVGRYIKRCDRKITAEILRTVVDQHNNSFLHYCVLWWYNKDNPFIQYLYREFQQRWIRYTDKNFKVINS